MQQLARIGAGSALRRQDELDNLVLRTVDAPPEIAEDGDGASPVQVDETRLRRLVGDLDESADTSEVTTQSRSSAVAAEASGVGPHQPASVEPALLATEPREAIPAGGIGRRLKRGVDIAGSLALLAALSPVLGTCAAAVRLSSPGPIFFRQKRIGQNGRPFTMLKFRTMYDNSDQRVHETYVKQFMAGAAEAHDAAGSTVFKLVGDARVTRPGHWLRRLSLDELPQLINVLRGEMSLVGPRPPLPYEVEQYRPRDLQRLRAVPGITGLWQVSGRNRTTFDQMIDLDIEYIQRWSLALDFRILQRTIPVVLFPDGH
jgi:lipopolysaccharide/colanic/teichoic acid biosynthesis glycosyltransferase